MPSTASDLNAAEVVSIIGIAVTWASFILRFALRRFVAFPPRYEDWIAIAALVLYSIDCSLALYFVSDFTGTKHPFAAASLPHFQELGRVNTFFYILATTVAKMVPGLLYAKACASSYNKSLAIRAVMVISGVVGIVYCVFALSACGTGSSAAQHASICDSGSSARGFYIVWTVFTTFVDVLIAMLSLKYVIDNRRAVKIASWGGGPLFLGVVGAVAACIYLVSLCKRGSGSQLDGYIDEKKWRLLEGLTSVLLAIFSTLQVSLQEKQLHKAANTTEIVYQPSASEENFEQGRGQYRKDSGTKPVSRFDTKDDL